MAKNIESDLRAIDGISQVTLSGYPTEEVKLQLMKKLISL